MRYEDGHIILDEPLKYYGRIESIEVTDKEKLLVHFYAIDENVLKRIDKKNVESRVKLITSDSYQVYSFYFEIDQRYKRKLSYEKSYQFYESEEKLENEEFRSDLYALGELPSIESSEEQPRKPVYAHRAIHGNSNEAKQLSSVSCFSEIEDQLNILSSDDVKMTPEIKPISDVSYLCVKNVGQGSTNILLNKDHNPLLYIDVGFQNKDFEFKHHNSKDCPIFLTHWDNDHYKLLEYFANKKKERIENIIIAPYQLKVGPEAVYTLLNLQRNGTKIFLIKMGHKEEVDLGVLRIVKSSSQSKKQDKNEKSFYYFFDHHGSRVLLAGDCDYKFIEGKYREDLDALVVYHHGARYRKADDTPAARGIIGKAYISAGNNKKYDHPTQFSKDEHYKNNWSIRVTRNYLMCKKCAGKISCLYHFKNKFSCLCCC